MPGINNRVFGSDIDVRIKKKLEARQLLAEKNRNPLDPIVSKYKQDSNDPDYQSAFFTHGALNDLNFDGVADLSSRTPFVRMWTAVEIRTHTTKNTYNKGDEFERKKGFVYQKQGGEIIEKEVSKYERIVYEIGNNALNEFYDPLDVRQVAKKLSDIKSGITSTDVIPNVFETNQNEFMKPAAGIISISSNTEGMLGAIKKTTVNFVVHNFHDYDKIYSKYFMKPGAQVFVDFGWDSIKELYKPQDLIDDAFIGKTTKGDSIEDILFGKSGYVTESYGDLETLIGNVVSFDSKIKENGSVECSVEIISKNAALIQGNVDNKLKNRIQYTLDAEIMNYAAKYFKDFELLKPNWTNSVESINDYTKLSFLFAANALMGYGNVPLKESLKTGVYWQTVHSKDGKVSPGNTKNIYISFGFFEDKILNGQFGVGEDSVNILGKSVNKESENFEVRFDSSESYIRWNKNLFDRQTHEKNLTKVSFIYPEFWDETYNTDRGKVPSRRALELEKENATLSAGGDDIYESGTDDSNEKTITQFDKQNKKRIPLRELFISLKVIKDAFKKNNTITDALTYILTKISEDSGELFDLKLNSSKYDNTKMSIIDRNFLDVENNNDSDFFDKLFMFKPMSKGSIVKSYDLSMSIPKGDFQNMLAIQTMPSGKSLFPLSSIVDKYLGLNMLDQDENKQVGVVYLPEMGSYQSDKMEGDNALDVEISFNFDDDKFLKLADDGSNAILDSAAYGFSKGVSKTLTDAVEVAEKVGEEITDGKVDASGDIKEKQYHEIANSQWTANSISQYHLFLAKKDNIGTIPTLLSFANLSLSIYGISSLVPGDIFRVDYLPERQRKLVYFQITKVSHEINQSNWLTKLETVPRIRSITKNESGLYFKPKDVVLSTLVLDSEGDKTQASLFRNYIKELKYIGTAPNGRGKLFSFKGRKSTSADIENKISLFKKVIKTGTPSWGQKHIPEAIEPFEFEYQPIANKLPEFIFKIIPFERNDWTLSREKYARYNSKYKYYLSISEDFEYIIFVWGGAFVVYPKNLDNDKIEKIYKYVFYDDTEKDDKNVIAVKGYTGMGFHGSDIRLKENIELIGKSSLGINIYEFDYINKLHGEGRYRGVMAQEVPEASFLHEDGYLWVDYSKVDVLFEKVY